MGNPFSKNNWLNDEIAQAPGLVSTTIKQQTQSLDGATNIPLIKLDKPLVKYNLLVQGLTSPVSFIEVGKDKFYLADQTGYIYQYQLKGIAEIIPKVGTRYEDGTLDPLILDLTNKITPLNPAYDERGLLALLLHPNQPDRYYLYYTKPTNIPDANCEVVLEEWSLDNEAKPLRTLFRQPHPNSNHFGSPLFIDHTDALILATGDGGGVGDPHGPIGNAQNIKSVWGKIIRIDLKTGDAEILAWGFRNPWRGCLDVDGSILVGEVGQDEVEGVHQVKPMQNHGWRAYENGSVYDQNLALKLVSADIKITGPLFWYKRALGRAIIGGYRLGPDYIFGDFTGGKYGDNVYLIRDRKFYLGTKIDRDHQYLNSFSIDREGGVYGLFKTNLGPSGQGAVYQIDILI